MEALETIRQRRSVRKFKSTPVAKELIEQLIDAGRLAPTARNDQPWEFIVITNSETRKQIAALTDYGKFIAEAPVCIAIFCKPTKYYLEDGSAATENILLSATALGLGSCWVAGDKKPYCSKIAELLKVPPDYKLVSLIAVGYSATTCSAPPKRSLTEVIHWEKF
ncbi:MAG: nitroreductase family protein [Candidatus Sumerlaeia bacterium]|nr:nitroreductase family protein [Candidatus Sumerlaeia bacterium]